ncbi:ABC transporter substrate-binding protein [Nakamurella lactea]|uniref:ABC transporter substrate-binding protein n=1 Tax=Nakamurella lactea TaxID=459515 RepID=UPI0012B671C0|nr:extracellular solute-binding protein [Nakamurella lactea]
MNDKSTADCGLSINFTGYSDAAQYDAFIKQGFQTNQKPTLFTWHTGDQLKELVDQGLISETTDLWKAAEANGDVPAGLIDNYTYDGKQYCVPLLVAYWGMYYNKKIFADNNLQVPTTWADFVKVADTLVAKGIVPLHQMNIIFEFVWFQALLVGSNPEAYVGLGTGKTKYTDPAVVDAVKAWYEMANKKYFIDPGVQTDPQTLLKTGKVAMAYFGTFFTGQLTSVGMKSNEDYGIFALPNFSPDVKKQQMVLETGPLCVGKGSQDEQAALAYSAWWMGQDAQQAWSDKRGDVSFNPKVTVKDPALAEFLKGQGDWEIQKRWLEATPNPIYTVASPAFGEFVTNPVADPMPMLTKIQEAADKYWAGK